ncbi:recombinase family protein [Candidatus Saccharibacteria bacterium]|nr:recombinase family protein [Candidatus Saccharibacteria bacterium]
MSSFNERKADIYDLYARKSTEDSDKQVQSLDDQVRIMKKIAEEKGLRIGKVFKESKSAAKPYNREKFDEMVKRIKDGKVNGILCWHLNRLSRNPLENGLIHQLLEDGRIKHIMTDNGDFTENEDLMFDMMASMNARYSKELSAAVTRGMNSRAEKGVFPGVAPIGYLNKHIGKGENQIIIDEERFWKVRKLWDLGLTGTYTMAELARIAGEDLHLKTIQRRKTGGKPLSYQGVIDLFRNPFYYGKFKWGGKLYDGAYKPMVTKEEWNKMQGLIDPKHAARPQKKDIPHLFGGMLKCGSCGYAIVTETKEKKLASGKIGVYHYCRCGNKCKKVKCEQKVRIPESELEEQIRTELQKFTIADDFFKLAVEALAHEDKMESKKQKERRAIISRQIEVKNKQMDGLRRARYSGEITDQAWFLKEQQSIQDEIDALQEDFNRVIEASRNWAEVANDVFMFARYAKEDFDSDDLNRKRLVLSRLGGNNLKLVGRNIVFTPNKYFVPILKEYPKIEKSWLAVRNDNLQMKKALKQDLIPHWWFRLDLNQ